MKAEIRIARRRPVVPAARRRVLLVAVVGVALAAPSGYSYASALVAGDPSFAKPRRYRSGKLLGYRLHLDGLAIGDLNVDGRRDIVATGSDLSGKLGGVSVFLNGSGGFATARAYRTGSEPSAVAIGDVNGDGRPDLATANTDDISVLINRGHGRFSKSVAYAAREAWDVAIGDLSGDGKADIVTVNHKPYVNSISVYRNRGDGTFEPRVDSRIGRVPVSVALADLNDDGHLDVAAACQNNTVSVLLNRGDGTFPPRVDYAAPPHPRSIAIGDMNGDRSPDLVTAGTGGDAEAPLNTVTVFLNGGDGRFLRKRVHRAKGAEVFFGPVAVGDLNADRRHDVAVGQDLGEGLYNPKRVAVLLGRGDGSFARRIDYPTGRTAADAWVPRGVAVGELNGDGKADIVQAKFIDVSVLLNKTRR